MNVHHHDLPPDVAEALKALESDSEVTFYHNEEELALISQTLFHLDLERLEELLTLEHQEDEGLKPVVLCDLEWAKHCANIAFGAGDWMGALEHYVFVLSRTRDTKHTSRSRESFKELEELLVTVHANTAQTLLNLARNDEALEQCKEALQLPILFEKPALYKKVIHRLKQCAAAPSVQARLAAAEAKSRHVPPVERTSETQISLCRIPEGELPAAEYAFEVAGGELVAAMMIHSICNMENDLDKAIKSVRRLVLTSGISRRIEPHEVMRMMELLGKGDMLAERKAKQANAKQQGQESLEMVLIECRETVWTACLQKDVAQTTALLTVPREWLSNRDAKQAIQYFLVAADIIAMVPPFGDRKVSRNSKDVHTGKPGAVQDLRAIVEITWLKYVEALHLLDVGELGPSEHPEDIARDKRGRPRWGDIPFLRMQHMMRLARGMLEPEEWIAPSLRAAISSGMEAECDNAPTSRRTGDSTTTTSPITPGPSLQDLCGYTIKRQAQIAAVKRGFQTLEKEKKNEKDRLFDPRRFAALQAIKRKIASIKQKYAGRLPVVDDLWHVCFQESQGLGRMALELLPVTDIEKSRPACFFVANRPMACPPPADPQAMRLLRSFREEEKLPGSTVAVEYVSDERFGENEQNEILRVLLKAIEARGGRPKRIAFGPLQTMRLNVTYLNNGGGGMPKDFALDDEDEHASRYERSVVEAFIEDDLEVQEQWIEGIFGELPGDRAHEERPQKKTPAQYRAELLKRGGLRWNF
jgi:hypothetical protein